MIADWDHKHRAKVPHTTYCPSVRSLGMKYYVAYCIQYYVRDTGTRFRLLTVKHHMCLAIVAVRLCLLGCLAVASHYGEDDAEKQECVWLWQLTMKRTMLTSKSASVVPVTSLAGEQLPPSGLFCVHGSVISTTFSCSHQEDPSTCAVHFCLRSPRRLKHMYCTVTTRGK
jgi:hypothetical protein